MKYKVSLGLGRLAGNHNRVYIIEANSEMDAARIAKDRYISELEMEIGADNPIWGKVLTIDEIEESKE